MYTHWSFEPFKTLLTVIACAEAHIPGPPAVAAAEPYPTCVCLACGMQQHTQFNCAELSLWLCPQFTAQLRTAVVNTMSPYMQDLCIPGQQPFYLSRQMA
jgi:hypothetical protein